MQRLRMEEGRRLLETMQQTIDAICMKIGYADTHFFRRISSGSPVAPRGPIGWSGRLEGSRKAPREALAVSTAKAAQARKPVCAGHRA